MRRPERLRWFALRLWLWLVVSYGAWHWMEPWVVDSLWKVSDQVWPGLFRGGLLSVEPRETLWLIRTGWPVVTEPGAPTERATTAVPLLIVRRMVSGFPLLMALMLAVLVTRKRIPRIQAMLAAMSVWWLVSWASVTGYAWHLLSVLRNARTSYIDPSLVPPPFQLTVEAYPMWEYYLSGYVMYLSLLIVPVVAPVIIWAWVCRRQVMRLVLRLRRRTRGAFNPARRQSPNTPS